MPTKARYNSARDRLQNSASNTLMELQEFARKLRSNQVARLEYGVITIDGENEEITIDDAIGGNEIINISKDGFIVKNTSGTEITRMNSAGFNLKNSSGTTIINMDLSGMSINDNSGNERMRFQDGAFDIKDVSNNTVIRFNEDGATYYGQDSGKSFLNFVRDGFRFGNIKYQYFTNSSSQKETRVLLTAYNSNEANRDTQAGFLNISRDGSNSTFFFAGETYENNGFDGFYLRYGLLGGRTVWSVDMLSADGENAIMRIPKHEGNLASYPGFGRMYYDSTISKFRVTRNNQTWSLIDGTLNYANIPNHSGNLSSYPGFGRIYYNDSISRLVVTSQNSYKPLAYQEEVDGWSGTTYVLDDDGVTTKALQFSKGLLQSVTNL